MNKYINTQSVIDKINSHEDLTVYEIEFITKYVKSQPKLRVFAATVEKMANHYNSLPMEKRVTLVRQIKGYLPAASYVPPED